MKRKIFSVALLSALCAGMLSCKKDEMEKNASTPLTYPSSSAIWGKKKLKDVPGASKATKVEFLYNFSANNDTEANLAIVQFQKEGTQSILGYVDNGVLTVITTDSKISVEDATDFFAGLVNVKNIVGIDGLNFQYVTSMKGMFKDCATLEQVNISSFNTKNVKDMQGMFEGCAALDVIDLSSLNTKAVEDMSEMFNACSNLKFLKLGEKFIISENVKVTDMLKTQGTPIRLLGVVPSETNTILSDPNKVGNEISLLQGSAIWDDVEAKRELRNSFGTSFTQIEFLIGCTEEEMNIARAASDSRELQTKDSEHKIVGYYPNNDTLRILTTAAEFKMQFCGWMFYGMQNLIKIKGICYFNTSEAKSLEAMFYKCNKLEMLDLSSFNTSKVTTMYEMFHDCNKLEILNLSSFNTSKVTDMSCMFWNCNNLKTLNLSNFNTSNVTNMSYMFRGCNSLQILDISRFNTSNVTGTAWMFCDCKSLIYLKLGTQFDISSARDNSNMRFMFQGASSDLIIKNAPAVTQQILLDNSSTVYLPSNVVFDPILYTKTE